VNHCRRGEDIMKKIANILSILLITCCAVHEANAIWADIPLNELIAENPVVLVGTIEDVRVSQSSKGKFDTAYIKVAEVLKNTLKKRKIKKEDRVPLSIPSAKGIAVSNSIRYQKGTQGVWILEYKDKTFWATYPKNRQPMKQKDEIVRIIRGDMKEFNSLPAGTGIGSNWAQFLGPNYNGVPSVSKFDPQGIRQLWSRELGPGCSSVTIAEGKLYTMGNHDDRDVVYCLDPKTGKKIWTFAYDCKLMPRAYEGGPNSTPTIANGRVYTVSRTGQIHCLDAGNGKKIWEMSVEKWQPKGKWWGFSDSPIVWDGSVFINATKKGLALNRETGLPTKSRLHK